MAKDDAVGRRFVQKCPACGTLNFTGEEEAAVKVCCACHKTRIAGVSRSEYQEETGGEKQAKPREREEQAESVDVSGSGEMDEDEEEQLSSWQNLIQSAENARGASSQGVSASGSETQNKPGTAPDTKNITLIAARYGRLAQTVTSEESPYLLGRDANLKDFLAQDERVSNEHCYLIFQNGTWYVRDHHSTNGTFLNGRDIGLNQERELHSGDELKLGHEADSMAFRVMMGR